MSEPFNSVRLFSQLTWNCGYIEAFSSNSKLSCWWKKQFLYTKSKLLLNKTVCTLLEWLLVPSYFVLAFCVIISAFAKWSGMQEKAQKHATGGQHNWRVWLNNLQFECFQWVCDFFCSDSFAAAMGWTVHIDFIFCSANVLHWSVLCLIFAGVLIGFVLLSLCSIWLIKVDFLMSFAHVYFLSKVLFKVSIRQMCCDVFNMLRNPDVARVNVRIYLSMLC